MGALPLCRLGNNRDCRISQAWFRLLVFAATTEKLCASRYHDTRPPAAKDLGRVRFAEETVTLCVSDQLRVPTAIGFIKPQVVIPAWAMKELSMPELNTILLHELAHLRRWDDWTNLVQKYGRGAFFLPSGGLVD